MWFLGLVIGALMGGLIGDFLHWGSAWLLFGALGAIAGIVLKDKARATAIPGKTDELERRIAALEREVRELKLGAAPAVPAAVASPVSREAPPTPAVASEVEATAPFVPHAVSSGMDGTSAAASASAADVAAGPATPREPEVYTPKAPKEASWLWQKLFGGNILAKVGVALLFFGLASGMKLAVDYGLFPPSVRLLIATLAGIAMIGFGYSRMRVAQHRMFGLALQGGGFGVLYLATYFALSWYAYINHATAFAIFAALGVACLVTAVRFEGEPLAILGISGAFFAPLLASTGGGSHVVLFSYYTVLTVMVLAVNWLRAWRALTVTAFVFTLVIGMMWASRRFAPEFFLSTEAFLILFSILFSLAPFLSAVMKRGPPEHWADTALLFGTPVAAAAAQSWLAERAGYGDAMLAWSAVGAGLYYSTLAATLFMRQGLEPLRIAHTAIAVAFYTLAVPLAFGVEVTSAFWAIEGLALAWFGVANGRRFAYAAGLLLQVVAGAYFVAHWQGVRAIPILNGLYIGSLVIVACGAASAWITKRGATRWLGDHFVEVFSSLAGSWALVWWLGANLVEVSRFAAQLHALAVYLGVLVGTAWALMAAARALPWPRVRYVALLLAALAVLGGLFDGLLFSRGGVHPLHDTMIFALPAAFATLYAILRLNERAGLTTLLFGAHLYALILLAITLLQEALWIATNLAPHVTLWRLLAWQLVPAALSYGIIHLYRHNAWPPIAQPGAYLTAGSPLLLAVAGLAALYANFNHAGGGSGLPYLPVASFFDVAQIAVIVAFSWWLAAAMPLVRSDLLPFLRGVPYALGFVWLSAMAMRIAHHWGRVPFEKAALLSSGIAQSMLSLLWTALALALMISATRKVLRQRWFVGFALLGIVGAKFVLIDVVSKGTITWTLSLVGVGLLILAASYFSPAPPRAAPPLAAP